MFLLVFELSVIVFVLGSLILLSLSYFCLGFRIVDSCYCSCVDLEFLNLALDFSWIRVSWSLITKKKKRQYLWSSLEGKAKSCVKHECWVKHVRERKREVHYFSLSSDLAGPCWTKYLVGITATTCTLMLRLCPSMEGVPEVERSNGCNIRRWLLLRTRKF